MRSPTLARRRLLRVGSAVLAGWVAGCSRLDAPDRTPTIPVYAHNADETTRDVRLVVSSLGDAGGETLPVERHYSLDAHATRRLLVVDAERFALNAFVDDAGTGTATVEVAPGTESYSRSGYLVVVDDETVDGSQVLIDPLPPESV